MDNSGNITITIQDKIATICFFHPQSNSFPSNLLKQLDETFTLLSNNELISVIILKSEGSVFCAGASFSELLQIENFEQGTQFFSGFANVINAMRKCNKIIIGAIQGKAVGGGVGLAAACDYVIAYENAAIKLSEIAIGIGPFVIEPVVSKKIGQQAMAHLTLNPTMWQSANWAYQNKLYNEVHSSLETLENAVQSKATELSNYNSEALFEFKKVLWQNTQNWEKLLIERAKISGKLVLSEFTKNALLSFRK